MNPESLRLTTELPPETRRVLQVETWRPNKHVACSPLQSNPRQAEVPQALAPMNPESLRLTSEFPPETRRVLQVDAWRPS